MTSGAQRKGRRRRRSKARPTWNKQFARFAELVMAGMYTEPKAFEIVTRIGIGARLTREERAIVREVVEHFR